MATPFESAQLNLKLFDLRREPVLREARAWFTRDFSPDSFDEMLTLMHGGRNASFRMVLGYRDMAASLVTTGAIDGDAFRAAHTEIFAAFSKIHPYLKELRAAAGEPELCGAHGDGGAGGSGCAGDSGPEARCASSGRACESGEKRTATAGNRVVPFSPWGRSRPEAGRRREARGKAGCACARLHGGRRRPGTGPLQWSWCTSRGRSRSRTR